MSNKEQFSDQMIAEALQKSAGIISIVAEKLQYNPEYLRQRVSGNPFLKAAQIEARERVLDLAEAGFVDLLKKKDRTAILFALKTLGIDRGYSARTEVTGPGGAPIEVIEITIETLRERCAKLGIDPAAVGIK
jgi:hypothetical protein